jgi:hypothetical protein
VATRDYLIRMPRDTMIVAACEDVGCASWLYGWETHVDEGTPLGAEQARYIRHMSGRTFGEQRTAAGITVFRFTARQRCFAEHRTRPGRYLVRGGVVREHAWLGDWIEDAAEHVTSIEEQRKKG